MSNDIAITIEGLGKRYRYGGAAPLSHNLRADITDWARGLWPRGKRPAASGKSTSPTPLSSSPLPLTPPPPPTLHPQHSTFREVHEKHIAEDSSYFWALRDINLEIKQGEVVGIIGRNGAGKSTLLKILSRITPPTTGKITYHGRVASLLEVGTGFHRELTGRENIFLNGSILGMKRTEIAHKLDEIVAFAEVDKFIDTPVKFYSSGMYVRLAFAVAAHLETDILLVDEVLAVGDAEFQRKCLGKMGDVAKQGRTILFVSHNMSAMLSLCNSGCLLGHGEIVATGRITQIVDQYMEVGNQLSVTPLDQRHDRAGSGKIRLTALTIQGANGKPTIQCGEPAEFQIKFESDQARSNVTFLIGIYDQLNRRIYFLDSNMAGGLPSTLPGSGVVNCLTGPINLTPGQCIVNVAVLHQDELADHVIQAQTFDVQTSDFYGTGKMTERQDALCVIPQKWVIEGNRT